MEQFQENSSESPQFSDFQRMVLINQFEILKFLAPKEAQEYEKKIKALQMGYTKHYRMLMHLDKEMSEKDCEEVFAILDMFRAIHNSTQKAAGLTDEERQGLKFRGFDGNNEPEQQAYASFLLLDDERYPELTRECNDPYINSHLPMLDMYRRMFTEWRELGKPYEMNEEMLKRIINARLG